MYRAIQGPHLAVVASFVFVGSRPPTHSSISTFDCLFRCFIVWSWHAHMLNVFILNYFFLSHFPSFRFCCHFPNTHHASSTKFIHRVNSYAKVWLFDSLYIYFFVVWNFIWWLNATLCTCLKFNSTLLFGAGLIFTQIWKYKPMFSTELARYKYHFNCSSTPRHSVNLQMISQIWAGFPRGELSGSVKLI